MGVVKQEHLGQYLQLINCCGRSPKHVCRGFKTNRAVSTVLNNISIRHISTKTGYSSWCITNRKDRFLPAQLFLLPTNSLGIRFIVVVMIHDCPRATALDSHKTDVVWEQLTRLEHSGRRLDITIGSQQRSRCLHLNDSLPAYTSCEFKVGRFHLL